MHRPGTTAVLDDQAGFEAQSKQAAVLGRAIPAAGVPAGVSAGQPGGGFPVTMAGLPSGRHLPCTDDPDLFFAESPDDVEFAKDLCRGCPARLACLTGALQRREPWGVWGGELFLRGEIVPRKRPRGRPRKDEVAA
jgi:WhiB family transcriptional regulator, redox-sensing transcriptional regulator